MIIFTILASALALFTTGCNGDAVLMYYNAGKIRLEGTNRGIVKEFALTNAFASTEELSLAIHYEQDLIFIADYNKVVRIHLVDGNGSRVVSGNGELFVNATAKHREEVINRLDPKQCRLGLIFTKSQLRGMYVDTVANKLYVACKSVLEMNLDGSGQRIAVKGTGELWEPTMYQGKFYFGASGWNTEGIYTATLKPNETVEAERFLTTTDVTTLALEKNSSKLYYVVRDKDEIRVIDLNETNPQSKLVIKWTSYNNIIRTIAVSGGYMFWTERTFSAVWDQYYWKVHGGKIKNGVIASNNTWLIKYKYGGRYQVYQLVAFEYNFPPSKPSTTYTTGWNNFTTTPQSDANLLLMSWVTLMIGVVICSTFEG